VAAVTTIEHAQSGLPHDAYDPGVRAACGAVYEALHDRATRRTPPHRIAVTRTLTGWRSPHFAGTSITTTSLT
jgi:hypothetical protein